VERAFLLARETTVRMYSAFGQSRGLGPDERGDLDVIASTGLVAKVLELSGTGSGGKGLSDDTLGTLVPGHKTKLPVRRLGCVAATPLKPQSR
jgi:hypothetical protein